MRAAIALLALIGLLLIVGGYVAPDCQADRDWRAFEVNMESETE